MQTNNNNNKIKNKYDNLWGCNVYNNILRTNVRVVSTRKRYMYIIIIFQYSNKDLRNPFPTDLTVNPTRAEKV